jgi:signal recognition particle receptor subunit beta
VEGALGAVVLLDTSRIEDCFPAIDYFEDHHIPFLVAVNNFDGTERFELDEVREALGVVDRVPVLDCDARRRESVKDVLVALTEEVLSRRLEHVGTR